MRERGLCALVEGLGHITGLYAEPWMRMVLAMRSFRLKLKVFNRACVLLIVRARTAL